MPANFSNLRLRYTNLPGARAAGPFVIDFNLSSLNFDINHATVGPTTPYTTEMEFDLSIMASDAANYETIDELAILTGGPAASSSITAFLMSNVFVHGNLSLNFNDLEDDSSLLSSSSAQVLTSLRNPNESDLFNLVWAVKVKFHIESPDADESIVLYPELILANPLTSTDVTLDSFNDELRLNYEVTYIPEPVNAPPFASPIGRATDELTDSLANLTNTLAANLTSTFKTQLQPVGTEFSEDTALWVLIKKGTDELSFTRFFDYMEAIFCGGTNYGFPVGANDRTRDLDRRRSLPFMNVDAYRAVKIAAEAFVMVNTMVNGRFTSDDIADLRKRVRLTDGVPNENELANFFNEYREAINGGPGLIPYLAVIRRKMANEGIKMTSFADAFDHHVGAGGAVADTCYGLISDKLTYPCFLELIWSYWHEESMMVQGLNAISLRFQNIRGAGKVDPLANLEIDPLRPLNNLMWGYIQDNQHRLTVRRRAYEYNHHYGISLKGEAARDMRFADPRSKFIEALHTLLNLASRFYKQSDDMTVRPDGFPILNALRETHLILSEGAHNQYGDLPSTSRAEMLMEQWLLARPEFRDFLPTRIMTAYPEPWMDRVAALNQLMGWTNTSVLHFNYLAIFGEKILLSIRFGNWADHTNRADAASNWAHYWRQEIQGYIHAYRAVTGVDLSADGVAAGQRVDFQQPSVHLVRKLAEQRGTGNGQMSKGAAKSIVK